MNQLKKFKKHQLIKLINEYEKDIEDLVERLEIMEALKEVIVKDYIIVDDEDNKTIQYLKKRISVVNDRNKKALYVRELNRITKTN